MDPKQQAERMKFIFYGAMAALLANYLIHSVLGRH